MAVGTVCYFRVISIAAMFILKLSYSNLSPFLDLENGKRAFNSAIMLTRRISIEDNDLPGRTSTILTQLWSAQARGGQQDKEPGLKLKTRLAASLTHDSLWTWREIFGGQGSSGANTPVGEFQLHAGLLAALGFLYSRSIRLHVNWASLRRLRCRRRATKMIPSIEVYGVEEFMRIAELHLKR